MNKKEVAHWGIPDTSTVHWHSRNAFRLIAGQQWRALIRLTSIDLRRTLRTIFGHVRLDALSCLEDEDVQRYVSTFPPKTSGDFLLFADLAKDIGAFDPWFLHSIRNAVELMIEIENGVPDQFGWQHGSIRVVSHPLSDSALALFVATEMVANRYSRMPKP